MSRIRNCPSLIELAMRDRRKYIKYFIALVVLIALGLAVRAIYSSKPASVDETTKMTLKAATASKQLGKEFKISIKDEKGKEIDGVTMRLENVELRDEIIVQGQKANSVAGRSFLVVNIKLVNTLEKAVEINTKDYLRLGINENEWLAPDIHNDPVLVQAISTKPTRVAFPVDAGLTVFTLQLGEISGDKEKVEINFAQ